MKKTIVHTDDAPAAVGPYSQAVKIGKLVYTAGQIPLDPATGQMMEGDIQAQTDRVLQNLQAVLKEAGSSLKNVVKTTVFLQDMGDFKAMNEVYGRYFDKKPPARSAVQVAALPLGAQVEIEAVALIKKKK
ncbi:MAG: RidA family protein [Ardenticatenaceae bacterium]|nr:RidA family protein [Ardenticatenaceae bacterium]MCB9442854.1 RidA family protein [Ardenticatenaceae bacterium]